MEDEQAGVIGGFAALDEASSRDLLDAACSHLRQQGCSIAVGPMNGNTWRHYRFVIESDGSPPFLLEPTNPPEHPTWWQQSGFSELVRYSSSRLTLPAPRSASRGIRERLTRTGVVIRPLDPQRYGEELRAIHELSLRCFSSNFLYTPLKLDSFMASYLRLRDYVDPRYVLIAERDGVPCGFVFGILDLNALQAGMAPAMIVKTLAVDPQSRCQGLGSVLVDEIQEAAAKAGHDHAIHALQHQGNTSLKITRRNAGERFRQYALFQKAL